MARKSVRVMVVAGLLFFATAAIAQQPGAQQPVRPNALFEQACASCHSNASEDRSGPDPATLRKMAPARIYTALTTGIMAPQATALSDAEKRAIAEYLGEGKIVSAEVADASRMANRCTTGQVLRNPSEMPSWNGWGVDAVNSRFQPAAAIAADQVPRLKLKWAFGFPGATAAYGQPTVVSGRVFVGSDTGYVYALDAATGCVHWSFQAQAGVRSAVSIGPMVGQSGRYTAYFGDMRANVYAVDATTGESIWRVTVEDHGLARITGSPKLHENRLYVPVSSWEEPSASSPTYPCCTFRGSLVALDIATGSQVWKTYTIAEAPKPTRKNSTGTQQWAPAGGAIWSSPTIDAKRNLLYVTTGNSYTAPAAPTTNALMALDMTTGGIRWFQQATTDDAWISGCGPTPGQIQNGAQPATSVSDNCPDDLGPDYDFAASAILRTLPNGREILVAGQKSGVVGARDPERQGALMWNTDVTIRPPGPQGEIVWGGAADNENAYFGLDSGAVVALQLTGGTRRWRTALEPSSNQHRSNSAAVTAIPGVVFSGGWDGTMRAFASATGNLLWSFNTVRDFETVNRVEARGGSIGGPGPTVAGGMLFVTSGYIGVQRGIPGNVILAFSVE